MISKGQSKVTQNRDLSTELSKIDTSFKFQQDCIVTEFRFTNEKN